MVLSNHRMILIVCLCVCVCVCVRVYFDNWFTGYARARDGVMLVDATYVC